MTSLQHLTSHSTPCCPITHRLQITVTSLHSTYRRLVSLKVLRQAVKIKGSIREKLLRILLGIAAEKRNVVPDSVEHAVRTNNRRHLPRPHHSQQRVKLVQQWLVTPAKTHSYHHAVWHATISFHICWLFISAASLSVWQSCLQCVNTVGWVSGRASGL